jgi:ferrous-iron efflux pump FieF
MTGSASPVRARPRSPGVSEDAGRLMRQATYVSVAAAFLLILVKLAVWLASGSVAILASLLDSLLDAAASMVNLLAVRQALVPADREHRFGHGKAEPLAGLVQSAFIAGSAVLLLVEAAKRLIEPMPIAHAGLGIAVMAGSMVVTVSLVAYQRHVIARTNSTAIRADSLHYVSDILVNGGVIVALVLTQWFDAPLIDPLLGAAIGVYILYSAWTIARLSLDMLMDREMPDEDRRRIRDICLSHPAVRKMHDLRTRVSGPSRFIQLHIEMDGNMTLLQAHEVSDSVEDQLQAAFPDAEVMIHQDPAGIKERRPHFA